MKITETLWKIEEQIQNIKVHKGIDFPKKLTDLEEFPESDFNILLRKVKIQDYNITFVSQGEIYGVFDFIAPALQRHFKNVIQFTPYIVAILAAVFGLVTGNYLLILSVLIPFIAAFLTGFIKAGVLTFLILFGLMIYFYVNENIVGVTFMIVWTISILLTRYIRYYVQQTLLKLSISNERIFVFLFYSRAIRLIDNKNDELIFSK